EFLGFRENSAIQARKSRKPGGPWRPPRRPRTPGRPASCRPRRRARASAAQQGGIGAPDGPRQRGGVGDPGEVREEEGGGPGADTAEGENGGEKEGPEEDDTLEGAGTGVPLEEEPAPEGVDGEQEAVEREGPADGATVAAATLPGAP